MLWRQGYETELRDPIELPHRGAEWPDGTAVLIAGADALTSFVLWTKLIEEDFDRDDWRGLVSPHEERAFAEYLSPSAQQNIAVAERLPIVQSRVLAGVKASGRLVSITIGPPTEEAWEAFANTMRSARLATD